MSGTSIIAQIFVPLIQNQDFEADFPQKVSLKMLNKVDFIASLISFQII